MRVSFLFWNIRRRPLQELVASLVVEHDVDFVILAECDLADDVMLGALDAKGQGGFSRPYSLATDIRIFSRFPESWVVADFDDPNGHVSVRRLNLGERPSVLLVAVHLQSKRDWNTEDQAQAVQVLARTIGRREEDYGHRRTILVGDLNMNPFEAGVVSAMGLHGVMTRREAEALTREIDANPYAYFYNPMWGLFGDRTYGPPGTYYYRAAKPVVYFWNMFDQVLLRPALMGALRDLRILDRTAGVSLLKSNGQPDTVAGSDHLPLLFVLDL